jgi:glycosyltransferase involved in cell wall biosynthesis
MRILEVNLEKSWRGGEKQTLLTSVYLHQQGFDTIIATHPSSPLFNKSINNKLQTIAIKNNWQLFVHLLKNANKYSIVHTHTAKSLLAIALAKPFLHAKIVFSRRHYKAPNSIFSKWKYNQADCITVVSSYIKNVLIESGIKQAIHVIYDSSEHVITDNLKIEELKKHIPSNKKIIATIAALEDEKNPLLTIQAIYELSKERNDFIFLHFGSGSKQNEMKRFIETNQLDHLYFLMGHIENIESIYPLFDGFILYSKNEGLGSSVIDAFLNKIPVLTSDVGGLHELVQKRGLLIAPNDIKTLKESLNHLLDLNHTETINLAYTFATNELNNDTIQKKYVNLFQSISN